jgi:hypothetical protein
METEAKRLNGLENENDMPKKKLLADVMLDSAAIKALRAKE